MLIQIIHIFYHSCSGCGIYKKSKILEFLLLNIFHFKAPMAVHNFKVQLSVKFYFGSL